MKINVNSTLDSSVSRRLGKTLIVDLENGWGWHRRADEKISEVDLNVFYNQSVEFELIELIYYSGKVRGVIGKIVGEHRNDLGKRIIGISLSDGENFDFEKNLCGCWCLSFGACNFEITNQGGLEIVGDAIFGWGRNVRYDLSLNKSPRE